MTCRDCPAELPPRNGSSGRQRSVCDGCKRARRIAYAKRWRAAHPDVRPRNADRCRDWRLRHPGYAAQAARDWRAQQREELRCRPLSG